MLQWRSEGKLENVGEGPGKKRGLSPRWLWVRVDRNNNKGFECCEDALQLTWFGQVFFWRLNVLLFKENTRMVEYGEVLFMKMLLWQKCWERWPHNPCLCITMFSCSFMYEESVTQLYSIHQSDHYCIGIHPLIVNISILYVEKNHEKLLWHKSI